MPRFKLTIEYAGTRYSGWQIQQNARTVQGELARAIQDVARRREFELYGAGRTDAGVHALAQVAHLDLYSSLPAGTLRDRLNERLPADIHINEAVTVPHRFHARHDAIARCYLYQISRRRTAFAKPFVWWVRETLDVAAMRTAAAAFVGMKNFAAFTADDPEEKSTRVLVDGIEIVESGALILIRVQGSHFLWKMVRRMVGVIAAVARGDLAPADATRLLEDNAVGKAAPAALAAPAAGLFLEHVRYKGEPPPPPIAPVIAIT